MSFLSQVKTDATKKPLYILVYGVDGVGKTTFAGGAPSPIFLGNENGLGKLDGKVAKLPAPKSFGETILMVQELTAKDHPYKTLVLDSLDHLEPMLWQNICDQHKAQNIEEFGYGKGYVLALKEWQKLESALRQLREKMNVILIAHSTVKAFNDPTQALPYDRFIIKMNDKAASLFRESVDAVLFCNYETFVKKDGAKGRASGDGSRKLFTERRPGFDAKNRMGLPFSLELDWQEFTKAMQERSGEKPETLIESIKEHMKLITDEKIKTNIEKKLSEFGHDADKLLLLNNKVMEAAGNAA